ncbi:hypothetical protein H4S06_003761 [Coemansia sp. BCRC 34490]|nr:hypothetical protein H4S06_003761 [Coemansia sp. BCRC 34490]
MASTGGMQTAIDEIRHSRNWIAQIVSSRRHEQQRAMLLHSPPTQPAPGAQAIPLQQVPPVCHVQRHTTDDDSADGGFLADEERAAAERQLKFHHHRRSTTADDICALESDTSAADSSASRLVAPAADGYEGPPKHGLCCGRQSSSSAVAITTRAVMFGLTQAMLVVFVAALCVETRSRPASPVFWHPLIMAAMLVLSVEATAVLQASEWPIPPRRKRTLHAAHIALHCLSAAAGVAGIGECISFKRQMLVARAHPPQQEEEGEMALLETTNSSPTSSSSTHACVGKLAVFLFLCQLGFGAYVRFSLLPTRVAGQQPKHYLKKYHRAAGYVVLLVLWLSAWLGIHGRQRISAGGQEAAGGLVGTWVWALVFAGLLVGILVPIDRAKFGFK